MVPPVIALIAGIVSARLLPFQPLPVWLALTVFLLFAISCRVRTISLLAAMWAAGVLTMVYHQPEAAPTIDAEAREVMVLEGCVVEPSVLSPDREQFTLELDREARARVSVYPREGETAPVLRYGQRVEVDAMLRVPRKFRQSRCFRLRRLPGSLACLLDRQRYRGCQRGGEAGRGADRGSGARYSPFAARP